MRLIPYMHDATDNDIIALILLGQQKLFVALVERYQHYVYTIVLRYVKDIQQAEEVTQDVFLKAYQALHNFNHQSKFSTWLYTIARNTCISHLRKNNIVFEEIQDNIKGYHSLPSIEQRSEKETVRKAIKMLPKQEAEVLTLFYLHEQTVEEIEKITGYTKSNVKVKLYRARKNLRSIVNQFFREELVNKK